MTRGWLSGSNVTQEMRAAIVDWLVQIQQYLSLSDITLHLAVANFDLIICETEVEEEEVQLLALVCLSLAAKTEEDCPPAPELLLPLSGDIYDKADLARVEKEAIKTLRWKLRRNTAVLFLHYFSEILGRPWRSVIRLARALLDLCLGQVWCGTVPPSHLASTALLAASYLEGRGWPEDMAKMTGYSAAQLLASLTVILNLVTGDAEIPEGVQEKHARVVTKIRELSTESIRVIVKNVQEDMERIPGNGSGATMIFI